jgi:uncharacterized membrane protein YeaQ/YmgE (transglycosylase-associated protein family)
VFCTSCWTETVVFRFFRAVVSIGAAHYLLPRSSKFAACQVQSLTPFRELNFYSTPVEEQRCAMGIVTWIVFGLLAGFVASMLVNKSGEGLIGDILLGIVGAVVGGFIADMFGWQGIFVFNPASFMIAVGGAVVVLIVYHTVIWHHSPRL